MTGRFFIAWVCLLGVALVALMVVLSWEAAAVPDPMLPTVPPSVPTYVVTNDGTQMGCTPDYQVCWSNMDDRG